VALGLEERERHRVAAEPRRVRQPQTAQVLFQAVANQQLA
jgi:hypothetical protein